MKKRVLAILLSALMVSNISACVYVPKNGIEDRTNETLIRTKSLDTNDSSPSSLDGKSNNETVRNISGVGQLKLFPFGNLTKASIWWSYEQEAYYIYINEWDVYRPMVELSYYHNWLYLTDNCITIDNNVATIALIDQSSKYNEPVILTFHFDRSSEFVELHTVPLSIKASSEYDTFLVNMLDANHGYYFLTSNMSGSADERMNGLHEWPLFMFETTDGGKSWNQISTNTFDGTKFIDIFKFCSTQIGIFSFTYHDDRNDLCERTYLTVDGGLTWNQILQLPYPFIKTYSWYSEVLDIEKIDDRYYLTVEVCGTLVAEEDIDHSLSSKYITAKLIFESQNLTDWNLIED